MSLCTGFRPRIRGRQRCVPNLFALGLTHQCCPCSSFCDSVSSDLHSAALPSPHHPPPQREVPPPAGRAPRCAPPLPAAAIWAPGRVPITTSKPCDGQLTLWSNRTNDSRRGLPRTSASSHRSGTPPSGPIPVRLQVIYRVFTQSEWYWPRVIVVTTMSVVDSTVSLTLRRTSLRCPSVATL